MLKSIMTSCMKKKSITIFLSGIFAAALIFLFVRQQGNQITTETAGPVLPAPIPETLAVGDVIKFGSYEQDNDLSNGTEAVEWQVLNIENDRALLISRYALDAKPYNEEWTRVTWENSSLRKWLNGEFLHLVFDPAERARVLPVLNPNPANPTTGMPGGNDTEDHIFLLSIDEAAAYFQDDETRQCIGTEYALENGRPYVNEINGESWWWLRTRGSSSKTASLVCFSGYVNTVGFGVNNFGGYLRPVFWLDLKAANGITG